jgi:hypothetical protein
MPAYRGGANETGAASISAEICSDKEMLGLVGV